MGKLGMPFSEVLFVVALHSKYTRALTSKIFFGSGCVGGDCYDGTHHGGRHDLYSVGGLQPYDDYSHMNGDDNSVGISLPNAFPVECVFYRCSL